MKTSTSSTLSPLLILLLTNLILIYYQQLFLCQPVRSIKSHEKSKKELMEYARRRNVTLTEEKLEQALNALHGWVEKIQTVYEAELKQKHFGECLNGGTKNSSDPVKFSCLCKPGFKGVFCEQTITTPSPKSLEEELSVNCSEEPCFNDGECIERQALIKNGFIERKVIIGSCICRQGYIGKFCETKVKTCEDFDDDPCPLTDICITNDDGFECHPISRPNPTKRKSTINSLNSD